MAETTFPLSKQETKVLQELAKGSLYKQIAEELSISVNTVKKHLKNVYRKLQVSNRRHAATTFNERISEVVELYETPVSA